MSLLEQFKNKSLFTKTEGHIIDYLMEHLDEVEFLTIGQLANLTYSSNASIIRLCKKLSYPGFKQFRVQLVKEIESHKYMSHDVSYSVPFQFNQTSKEIMNNMYSLYHESIKLIHSQLNPQAIINVSHTLMKAKRIFIFAIGDSQFTAQAFMNKLMKIDYYPILASAYHEELYICQTLKKGDCALFITYGGKSENFKECMQICHQKDIETMVITANSIDSVIQQCKHKIIIPDKEKEYKIATFYSQLAIQYILNLIFSIIYNRQSLL